MIAKKRFDSGGIAAAIVLFALGLTACSVISTEPESSESPNTIAPQPSSRSSESPTDPVAARPSDPLIDPRSGPVIAPPTGFQLHRRDSALPRMLGALVKGEATTPVLIETMIYVVDRSTPMLAPSGSITLTTTTYATTAGALATYNGWFAEYGFPAAAERKSLNFGDAAELFDLEWPSLHAVIARADRRFALVVADRAIPASLRSEAMESLARAGIGADPLPAAP